MKIGLYVQQKYAKQLYANECFDARQFIGVRVIADVLKRAGYDIDYVGHNSVTSCDVILISLTSECDYWDFIRERCHWPKGDYKVIVGGAGVVNNRPFLEYADYYVLGRGEDIIVQLVENLHGFEHESVINTKTFSMDKIYQMRQGCLYPHEIIRKTAKGVKGFSSNKNWQETSIGCPHKCLFCQYTWTRKQTHDIYETSSGDKTFNEHAILDMAKNGFKNIPHRMNTVAIDGCSEKLRWQVNKKIKNEMLIELLVKYYMDKVKIYKPLLYNIVGFPNETEDDYEELLSVFSRIAEALKASKGVKAGLEMNNTPFHAMPLTPAACWPMPYREMGKILLRRPDITRATVFESPTFRVIDKTGGRSLATVFLAMLTHRGEERHADTMRKIALSSAFWNADSKTKLATLEKYFDPKFFFGAFNSLTLPTRNIRTYARVEAFWDKPV